MDCFGKMAMMNWRAVLGVLAAVTVTMLVTREVVSQDKATPPKGDKENAPKEKAPDDMQAMMEAMAKYATPGEYHRHLNALVGSWNAECKFWMEPGGEPQTSKGTTESKWVLGGRFLMQEFGGQWQDQPFNGIGFMGYDNYKKQYVCVWMDTMSTGFFTETGSCDASGKTFTFQGQAPDCMTGQEKKTQSVYRIIDPNKFTFEMYDLGPDGKEFKNLEIVYTRK